MTRYPGRLGLALTLSISLSMAAGCSTARPQAESSANPAPAAGPLAAGAPQSSIEFSYTTGHTQRKLILNTVGKEATGRNYHQKQVLQEGKLEGLQYDSYFLKVEDYCSRHSGQSVSPSDACKSLYQIVLKRGERTCRAEGCRNHSADDSALSHLIREGEFLLSRAAPKP